eukprot:s6818_g5.t2
MSVSAEEVAKHNKDSDCWVIVGDQVLDVTAFLSEHPGGKKSIMMFAGKDATEEFDMLHDRKVIKKYGLDEAKLLHSLEHSVPTSLHHGKSLRWGRGHRRAEGHDQEVKGIARLSAGLLEGCPFGCGSVY